MDQSSERRRMPRIHLSREQFRLSQNGKIFSVFDLSPQGMGLRILDRDDLFLFSVGRDLSGTLNLRGEKFPVKGKVQRLAGDLIGVQFQGLDEKTQAALNRFLDPALLGQELRAMPVSSQSGASLWYHGPSGTDLLLWREMDGEYVRLLLCCHSLYVEWSAESGVMTGRSELSDETLERSGVIDLEMREFSTDESTDPQKLDLAKRVILSSNLPSDLKKRLSRHLAAEA